MKKKICLLVATFGILFSVCAVSATTYTKTKNLSASLNGTSASLTTTATYSTTGNVRWKDYGYNNYKVNFTSTFGITMTKASWSTSGSDEAGYHQKKFTWSSKSYLLSDPNKNAVNNATKTATYRYDIYTDTYSVK